MEFREITGTQGIGGPTRIRRRPFELPARYVKRAPEAAVTSLVAPAGPVDGRFTPAIPALAAHDPATAELP